MLRDGFVHRSVFLNNLRMNLRMKFKNKRPSSKIREQVQKKTNFALCSDYDCMMHVLMFNALPLAVSMVLMLNDGKGISFSK